MTNVSQQYRRIEYALLALALFLKGYLFFREWGSLQGFDAKIFISAAELFKPGQPFPGINDCASCYHPPFSFLSTMMTNWIVGDLVVSSQILSWLSLLLAFLPLRAALKHIGILHTLPGILFLYCTSALPIFIFLSTASTYDSAAYLFSILTLYLSILLFWDPPVQWHFKKRLMHLVFLLFTLVLGLQNKYTGILNIGIPCIVVLIRCRPALLRSCSEIAIIGLLTAILISPIYIRRNYLQEGELFPTYMGMHFERDLERLRALRDADRFDYIAYIMRITDRSFLELNTPLDNSFFHTIWLQTWKRENNHWELHGPKSALSGYISNVYFFLFILPVLLGSTLFAFRRRKQQEPLHDFGNILLLLSTLFSLAQLAFAYVYPLGMQEVIKATYIAPALLWIPFASGYCVHSAQLSQKFLRYKPFISTGLLGFLLLFVVLNHTVPVY